MLFKTFVSVIVNVSSLLATELSIIKYQSDQVRIRLILHLINDISVVLQKFSFYLNDTLILTFFVPPFPILPIVFILNLKEALLLLTGK